LLENVLNKVPIHDAAMAFRPKRNIAHNAQIHAGAKVIVRIDFKDFFPSITFKRVKWMFQNMGFNEGVSTIFALISTEAPRVELTLDGQKHFVAVTERFLPQGACTSPAITNILCRVLDKRLCGAAQKLDFVYTRYADDLIFSSRAEKCDARAMRDLATTIINDEKFEINGEKTAILRTKGRQTVTGLVVNAQNSDYGKPRVSRRDIRNFRAFLHQYELRGREAMTEKLGQDSLSYARGYLSFVHMVSAEQEAAIKAKHSQTPRIKYSMRGVLCLHFLNRCERNHQYLVTNLATQKRDFDPFVLAFKRRHLHNQTFAKRRVLDAITNRKLRGFICS